MRRLTGFSILELLLVMTIIAGLLIVASPSFFRVLKGHTLTYDVHQLVFTLKQLQSNAFVDHRYYQFTLDADNQSYQTALYTQDAWLPLDTYALSPSTQVASVTSLTATQGLVYDPQGNAFLCPVTATISTCLESPLTATQSITVYHESRYHTIELLPVNGYVSHNVVVK
jgi:Tfp pilus assembly protein FimT